MKKSKLFLLSSLTVLTPAVFGIAAVSCGGEKPNTFSIQYISGEQGAKYYASSTKTLDLSEADITEIPQGAFSYQSIRNFAYHKDESNAANNKYGNVVDGLITWDKDNNGVRIEVKSINIEKVILPKKLTKIGPGAFQGLGSLKSIIFPDTIESIGEEAFAQNSIEQVTIPASLTELGRGAFSQNLITSFDLSNATNLKIISQGVLANNKLSEINLSHVSKVLDGALAQNNFTQLTIGQNLVEFSPNAFQYVGAPEGTTKVAITVDGNNDVLNALKQALEANPKLLYTITNQ
ncbi:leucine-rich repeat domain-containing protein [Metamycoplasma neophronis]|uniref:Leucine-rich repeat domain-containing protein n=1 Tax=Metamycoplasma neophronis TaxID=872983 RepID=A0ABY2Z1D7_9BACT|nr:leucine-rich repeat protein [Metamycoplasma neophronis]TPR54734.1 hypothetical protein FJR74_00475 [Metamycoplasma neophronis]